jgi:hydrogenase nickel incorporation protein HypA/HybF
MHEVGIMESTLAAVRREALARNAAHVDRIVLRIGVLSGVEPEALRFAFEACSPGTLAEGAEFDIVSVPALAHCPTCDRDFAPGAGFICCCPTCGNYSGDLRAGRELELSSIEFTPHPTPS